MPGESEVRIAVPPGWERVADPVPGVALLIAARRRPASGVLPSMAVAVADLAPGWSRAGYLDGLRAELAAGLDDADIEDEDSFELDGGRSTTSGWRTATRAGTWSARCGSG